MVDVYVRDTGGKVDAVSSLALSIGHLGFLLEKEGEDNRATARRQRLDRAGHADTWPRTSPAPQRSISARASPSGARRRRSLTATPRCRSPPPLMSLSVICGQLQACELRC
ncbi:hypothetical protein MUK42_04393 [Musa troglodytarum]|uniref:Uncharacterized protein n=1 Tax=Musa troglodytarum TaxID=320322 RepID=A0A9E7FRQ0_9LILI|nr:hypothetical protein MUK42_04393 [Musa troglodytarum]